MRTHPANRLRLNVRRAYQSLVLLGFSGCAFQPDGTLALPAPAVEVVDAGEVTRGVLVRAREFKLLGENLEAELAAVDPFGAVYKTRRLPAAGESPGWILTGIPISAGSVDLVVTVYTSLGVFSTAPTTVQVFP